MGGPPLHCIKAVGLNSCTQAITPSLHLTPKREQVNFPSPFYLRLNPLTFLSASHLLVPFLEPIHGINAILLVLSCELLTRYVRSRFFEAQTELALYFSPLTLEARAAVYFHISPQHISWVPEWNGRHDNARPVAFEFPKRPEPNVCLWHRNEAKAGSVSPIGIPEWVLVEKFYEMVSVPLQNLREPPVVKGAGPEINARGKNVGVVGHENL